MDDRSAFAQQRDTFLQELGSDQALQDEATAVYARADAVGYSYVWDWLGVPIIQTPTDVVVLQELVWRTRPQLVIETGVARGGSVILFASLLQLLGEGRVIGVDVDLRPHNRAAIEEHPLGGRVELLDGSSTDPAIVAALEKASAAVDRVMVVLDSDHTQGHVAAELEALSGLVSVGCHLVVADTIIEHVPTTHPPGRSWGPGNSPATAVDAFLGRHPEFELDLAVERKLLLSSNPGGYLLRTAVR
jgi:cephalosporin hydroxylase